jgi:hypothetical protein
MFHVEQFFWKLDFFVFFGVSYFLAKRPTSAKQQMWSTACPTKCSTWNIFFGSNLGKAAALRTWISGRVALVRNKVVVEIPYGGLVAPGIVGVPFSYAQGRLSTAFRMTSVLLIGRGGTLFRGFRRR